MKNQFWVLPVIFVFSAVVGCGTDIKPTAFVDILRDPNDINELSTCLSEEPAIDDKTVKITLDKQCLVDFSKVDKTDPSLAPSFAEIVANPEIYMDKLLTFEAVTKRVYTPHHIELYTNDFDLRFFIHALGAPLYRLDEEGEEVPIEPNEKYRFKCRIYLLSKDTDSGNMWHIDAISTNEKIIHLSEFVE